MYKSLPDTNKQLNVYQEKWPLNVQFWISPGDANAQHKRAINDDIKIKPVIDMIRCLISMLQYSNNIHYTVGCHIFSSFLTSLVLRASEVGIH